MITLRRASLKMPITHKGKEYERVYKKEGADLMIEVLPASLKHREDLHGKPYKASEHYFKCM